MADVVASKALAALAAGVRGLAPFWGSLRS